MQSYKLFYLKKDGLDVLCPMRACLLYLYRAFGDAFCSRAGNRVANVQVPMKFPLSLLQFHDTIVLQSYSDHLLCITWPMQCLGKQSHSEVQFTGLPNPTGVRPLKVSRSRSDVCAKGYHHCC